MCVPYSLEACEDVAKSIGKNLGGGGYNFASTEYITKGCYAYRKGYYAGNFYFGMGGTKNEMKMALAEPKYRPLGYDCKFTGNVLLIFQ